MHPAVPVVVPCPAVTIRLSVTSYPRPVLVPCPAVSTESSTILHDMLLLVQAVSRVVAYHQAWPTTSRALPPILNDILLYRLSVPCSDILPYPTLTMCVCVCSDILL